MIRGELPVKMKMSSFWNRLSHLKQIFLCLFECVCFLHRPQSPTKPFGLARAKPFSPVGFGFLVEKLKYRTMTSKKNHFLSKDTFLGLGRLRQPSWSLFSRRRTFHRSFLFSSDTSKSFLTLCDLLSFL